MKKQLLGFAAISLLAGASSCTQEAIESVDDGKSAIEFKTALGKQTKATEVGLAELKTHGSLNVYSFYSGSTDKFNKFELTYNDPNWTYTTSIDQPGMALRYYSVYPETNVTIAENTSTSATTHSFDYTIQTPAANQEDLIAATSTTSSAAVNLQFGHVLSQVNFEVQAILGVKIAISNLQVSPGESKGTYTFGSGWNLDGTSATYTYPILASAATTLAAGTSNAIIPLKDANGALMLMPQTFADAADGTFSFNFTLTADTDGDGDIDDVVANNLSVTANLCDFDTKTWAPGTRYRYIIDFTSYLAGGPITFTVDVTPWVNDSHNTAAETLHVAEATLASIQAAIAKHSAANNANGNLGTFPIAVSKTLAAGITLDAIAGFDSDDEIRIEFPDVSSANNLTGPTGWTQSGAGTRVVTLKKE